MTDRVGENLRRLMATHGLTVDEVVLRTGLDRRTVRKLLDGGNKPHPRTINRLARGLGVSADEFFVEPGQLVYRQFDCQTNPVVGQVVESRPELFANWTSADFRELYSRFGSGGPLTYEGTLEAVGMMNRNRQTFEKLAVLLETGQADVVRGIVDLLYQQVALSDRSAG